MTVAAFEEHTEILRKLKELAERTKADLERLNGTAVRLEDVQKQCVTARNNAKAAEDAVEDAKSSMRIDPDKLCEAAETFRIAAKEEERLKAVCREASAEAIAVAVADPPRTRTA